MAEPREFGLSRKILLLLLCLSSQAPFPVAFRQRSVAQFVLLFSSRGWGLETAFETLFLVACSPFGIGLQLWEPIVTKSPVSHNRKSRGIMLDMHSYAAGALILPQPSPDYVLLCHIYRGVAVWYGKARDVCDRRLAMWTRGFEQEGHLVEGEGVVRHFLRSGSGVPLSGGECTTATFVAVTVICDLISKVERVFCLGVLWKESFSVFRAGTKVRAMEKTVMSMREKNCDSSPYLLAKTGTGLVTVIFS